MTANVEKGPVLGQRHLQVFLLFLSIVVNYVAKFNIGVVIVAMTNAETTNPNFDEYDWNEMERSYILSSFFWGYFVTQFPGGYLCRRFGAKRTMFVSTFGSALFAITPPFCVSRGGWQVYCGIRVIQGLFQGLLFPCIHAHLAVWCPVDERNRLGALANTGIECGTVLAMFLSGFIAASSLGWPGVSYVSCAVGMIWCFFWWIFAANSPSESKLISEAELNYIESSINATKLEEKKRDEPERKIPIPWTAILTSLPFWALLIARVAQSWSFTTLQAQIPSYMNGVLNMDMKKNALFSALPYLVMWCMSYVYVIAADVLLNRGVISLNMLRKSFNTLSFWVPAVGLIAVGFVGEDKKILAIVLMTTSVGFNAGNAIGSALNTIDLSPNHAGMLMGIVNTAANFIPIVTPLVVGVIVHDEHERTQWQVVFVISAVIFAAGNLFFIVFGSTERQIWDAEGFLTRNELHNESFDQQPRNAETNMEKPPKY